MKKGWTKNTLPDISENLDSRRIPITKGKREGGKYPYYGASGIVDYVSEYLFDEDILLISEDGANLLARSTPIAFSVSGKVWVNNHAHILKFKNMCTQRLVEYFFAYKDISDYVTGAAQPKLSQKNLNLIQIPLPPLSEQKEIVEYLDSSFAKIDKLKENAAKNLEEAKALFQSALKDALEPKEGWEEKTLGEVAKICGGKRLPKGCKLQSEPTNHKYIRVADFLDNGTVCKDEIQYITDDIFNQIKRYTISSDDVYISIAGTIGKSGIVPDELNGANLTENACKLVLNKEQDKRFIYFVTISPFFKEQINILTKKSAQPKLALTRLATVNVPIPPLSEQQSIVSYLDSLSEKVNTLQQNYSRICDECDALKQAILRQVFE